MSEVASMAYDPTDEPRGWYKAPRKTRNLQVFRQSRRRIGSRVKTVAEAAAPVTIRRMTLRAGITAYIETADRCGLNPSNVARLYRLRADNGYIIAAPTIHADIAEIR